jgi:hypothetical protein
MSVTAFDGLRKLVPFKLRELIISLHFFPDFSRRYIRCPCFRTECLNKIAESIYFIA